MRPGHDGSGFRIPFRKSLIGGVVLALGASLAGPAAATPGAVAASDMSSTPPISDTAADPDTGQLIPTSPLIGEDLAPGTLSITQTTPARPGGYGDVQIAVAPEDARSPKMRDLVITLDLPKGATWRPFDSSAWRCELLRDRSRLRCERDRDATGGDSVAFKARVLISESLKVSTQTGRTLTIVGKARWSTGVGAARETWLETSSGAFTVQPALGASLEVPGDGYISVVTNAERDARALQLMGRLRHIKGQEVSITWSQISGPTVTYATGRTSTTDENQISQTVILPRNIQGERTLVFQLTARSGGQVVRSRAKVRITAAKLQGPVAPRNNLIAPALDQAPDELVPLNQKPEPPVEPPLPGSIDLVGPDDGLAPAGDPVTLRLESNLSIATVTWVTQVGTDEEETTYGGTSLGVITPDVGAGPLRATAYVDLAIGRSVVRSVTLLPEPDDEDAVSGSDADDKLNRELLCSVAEEIEDAKESKDDTVVVVTSKDQSTLTLIPAKTTVDPDMFPAPGKCSGDGDITFTHAKLSASAGSEFTDVEGTMSFADAISLTWMSWKLPVELSTWVPPTVASLDFKGDVGIAFNPKKAGTWAAIKGTTYMQPYTVGDFRLTSIPLVPLPESWQIDPDKGAFLQFFDDEDKGVPAGSINLVQRAESKDPAESGSIQVSLVRMKDASGKPVFGRVIGAASNIEVFHTPKGDPVYASGDISFDLTRDDTSGTQLNLKLTCASPSGTQVTTNCAIADDVYFQEGRLRMSLPRGGNPTTGGYILGANILFGRAPNTLQLRAEGKYTSKDKWSISVQSDVSFDMGPGLATRGFKGTVERAKKTIDDVDKVVNLFRISTTMSTPTFADAVTVDELQAELTNMCEKDEPDCKATEVKIKGSLKVTTKAPGDKKITVALSGAYNWATGGMLFKAAADADSPVGPAEWNFKAASIFASRGMNGYCRSQNAGDRAPATWAMGFQGKATLFGQAVDLTLQYSAEGSCLWGTMGKLDTEGIPTSNVRVSWTSFPKGAYVQVSEKESFKIKANTGSLVGKVALPQSLESFLGVQGNLEFTGEITGKFEGGKLEIAYTNTSDKSVVENGGSSFNLTKIALGMKWAHKKSVEVYASARGDLVIRGNPSEGIPDSVTTLGISLSVAATTKGVAIALTAAVDAAGTITPNAFGIDGLNLETLAVSGELELPSMNVEIGFSAAAYTPKAWEKSGLKAGAYVRLAFKVGRSSPWCIDFQIGEQGRDVTVLDVANAGYLLARYFKLLIAPAGCTVPISVDEVRKIPAGFGFAFDGTIMGAPIIVALNVSLGSNFTMQGDLNMPKLDLPLITLSGSDQSSPLTVSVDFDVREKKYDASIDAYARVGAPQWGLGAQVKINAALKTSGDDISLLAKASAKFAVTGAYMEVKDFTIDLVVPKRQLKPKRAWIGARIGFGIFDKELFSGAVDMGYDRGRLIQFGVIVGAGLKVAAFGVKLAEFSGNVAFRYCLGTMGASKTAAKQLADCAPFNHLESARPGYRIDLGGKVSILGIGKSFYWEVATQESKEGDPKFEPVTPPGPVPGPTTDIDLADKPTRIFMEEKGNSIPMVHGGDAISFRSIRPAEVKVSGSSARTVPACDRVQVGFKEYRPAAGEFPPAEALEPTGQSECGLIGTTLNAQREVRTLPIICSSAECVGDDLRFRSSGETGTAKAARDQILTQLRQTPGLLTPGESIAFSTWASGLRSRLRVEDAKGVGYVPVLVDTTTASAYRKIAVMERFKGRGANASTPFYLTETGVFTSWAGGSYGADVAFTTAPPVDKQPVMAIVGQEMIVYCGPSSDSGVMWKFGKDGYKPVGECTR